MQGGNIFTLKNMQGEIIYIYFKFLEQFPHLATFNFLNIFNILYHDHLLGFV